MARPRYPSDDEAARRRGGIWLSFEVLNPDPSHPEQAAVFADPEMRGVWAGLLLKAGHAFAGRTGDRCTLSLGDLVWITGRRSQAGAESSLARVCTLMGYQLESISGRSWIVHCKNLSQNQRWTPRTRRSSAEHSAQIPPSESDSDSSSSKTQKKKSARPGKIAAPEALTPEQTAALSAWCSSHADPSVRDRAARLPALIESCLDHHRAKENRFADWVAVLRTWIKNDVRFAREAGKELPLEKAIERARVREVMRQRDLERGTRKLTPEEEAEELEDSPRFGGLIQ